MRQNSNNTPDFFSNMCQLFADSPTSLVTGKKNDANMYFSDVSTS